MELTVENRSRSEDDFEAALLLYLLLRVGTGPGRWRVAEGYAGSDDCDDCPGTVFSVK